MTFGWMSAIGLEMGRRRAYNITSLPEQFEMFHNYHQQNSQRPTGRRVSEQAAGESARGRGRREEEGVRGRSKRKEKETVKAG